MTTPKKETVFLVSCYDPQAHALRRQALEGLEAALAQPRRTRIHPAVSPVASVSGASALLSAKGNDGPPLLFGSEHPSSPAA